MLRKATGMTRWNLLAGVAAVLMLAGCAVSVPGAPLVDPVALRAIANAPLTAAGVFGPDASTVAPCSMVAISELPLSLDATQQPADGFDDCPLSVALPDGTRVDVSVGPLETQADQPFLRSRQIATLPRGLTLATDASNSPGFCNDYLRFGDGVSLDVLASAADATSTADVCPAAEALARNAATAIRAGSIRHVAYAAGSLGRIDPCPLVTDDTLTAAGLTGFNPAPYPQHHECVWTSPTETGTTLRLLFDIDTPPQVTDATTDTSSQIAGRASVTTKIDKLCLIRTGLNTAGSANRVEVAMVSVDTTITSTVDACTVSQAVATAVWPKLPGS